MASWAWITGARGAGKTSLGLTVAARLQQAGVRVGGFVQLGVHDEAGVRVGYDLVRLGSGQVSPLARRGTVAHAGQEVFHSHVFEVAAFGCALDWLRDDARDARVLVLDEVSKLEVAGRGHTEARRLALAQPAETLAVLCVRAEVLPAVLERFLPAPRAEAVATLETGARSELVQAFTEALQRFLRGAGR